LTTEVAAVPGAPTLTDGIVTLRPLTLSDVADHLAGEDDEHAQRFGWFPKRSTEETVRAAILRWRNEWQTAGATRTFGAEEAASGDLVGGCELRLRGADRADISYWTFHGRRGHGFATRAVRLLCD
jgi:RimJ/RimL family protein N-acetyltransferase